MHFYFQDNYVAQTLDTFKLVFIDLPLVLQETQIWRNYWKQSTVLLAVAETWECTDTGSSHITVVPKLYNFKHIISLSVPSFSSHQGWHHTANVTFDVFFSFYSFKAWKQFLSLVNILTWRTVACSSLIAVKISRFSGA